MKNNSIALSFFILIMSICIATGCSQQANHTSSKSNGVREDVLSVGLTFTKEMKKSVRNGDIEIREIIDDLAYELKVACIENNNYVEFSDKEMKFIDTLGEIRVAYDHVVFSRNSKYNKSIKKKEAALDNFNHLIATFEKEYGN